MQRRHFLQSIACATTASLISNKGFAAESKISDPLAARLYKTLKIGMVKHDGPLIEKFKIAKDSGFKGIELNSPGYDIKEVRKAIKETGLVVDGTVCESHWKIRHTDPNAETRAQALKDLQEAIRATHAVGGSSVLLVAGRGDDGSEEDAWKYSVENISKALPVAAEYGVGILIENVWNKFCYDHEGDHKQTADKFVKYVDAFNSPLVGMHFDIGNHWKYGSMGDWIRQLGKRIVKLDVKGFSRKENKFTPIGEGDIDYADVRKALLEINFYGWLAAEVAGGDQAYLTDVSKQMDVAFGL